MGPKCLKRPRGTTGSQGGNTGSVGIGGRFLHFDYRRIERLDDNLDVRGCGHED
jgi:hypothetical protein